MGSVANAALEAVVGFGLFGLMFGTIIAIPMVIAVITEAKERAENN
jgi:hypothetical protein